VTNTVQESTGAPKVLSNGQALDDESLGRLLELRVEQPLNAPAQATMRFYDEDFVLCDSTKFEIANEMQVSFPDATGTLSKVFVGEVVAVAVEQGVDGLHELIVTLFDKSHRLGRNTTPKTYNRQKYKAVVRGLAMEVGLRADVRFLGETEFEYLVQTTDALTLLNEMARRTGAQWRVVDGTLTVFEPPMSQNAVAVVWGEDLLRFRTRFSGSEWNDSVTVRGWDPKTKQAIVGTDATGKTYLTTAPLATAGRKKVSGFGAATRQTGGTVVTSPDEANEVAKALRANTSSVEVVSRGEVRGNPLIAPGGMIDISGVGTRMSGKYYLSEVEHVYNARGYATRFTAGSLSPSSLVDLTGGGGRQRPSGPMIGIVTNIDDEEGAGRVKVKLPAQGDDIESAWARMATLGGGSGRGLMFMPSVNDEVLVMFEQGDERRPLIIGSVWNGRDAPPFTAAEVQKNGKAHRWGLITPTGHKLTFVDDATDDQRLEVAINDGKTLLWLGRKKVEIVANNTNLELRTGQASVLLKQGSDVIIEANNITLNAKQALKMSGLQVEVNGKTTVKVASSATMEVSAGATSKVSAGAMMEISGALVKIN
jgi:phage baseplate assembly protein gpV